MISSYYNWIHGIGFHMWDIPAILVLVIMIVVFIVHKNNQKKREDEFEKDLEEKLKEIREGKIEDTEEQVEA